MDWKLFSHYYLIFLIPIFINVLFTFIQFIKYHSYNKVFVSKTLQVICYSATFFALFGFLSNLIDYVTGNDWFLLMMLTCYVVLNVILIILRNEKILYNQSTGVIICKFNFKRYKFQVQGVTRIYCSNEFLDLYLGNKRIRYRNNFLCRVDEFLEYVQQNSMAYYG